MKKFNPKNGDSVYIAQFTHNVFEMLDFEVINLIFNEEEDSRLVEVGNCFETKEDAYTHGTKVCSQVNNEEVTQHELNQKLKKDLYFEIIELENELKEKKEQLYEICDHLHFNGQSAWSEDSRLGVDRTKTCSICGATDWV